MAEHLSLSQIALDDLVMALDDHGDWAAWYLEPVTGRIVLSTEEAYSGVEDDEDTDSMIAIDPLPSRQAYESMVEFAGAVSDPRTRDELQRALEGQGAFRRFRRALDEWPELGLRWRDFDVLASEMRALEWLLDRGIVRRDEVEAAIDDRRRQADAVLAAVGDRGLPQFDAADVPDRWEEIARRVDDTGGVVLTRDGREWCTITPIRANGAT